MHVFRTGYFHSVMFVILGWCQPDNLGLINEAGQLAAEIFRETGMHQPYIFEIIDSMGFRQYFKLAYRYIYVSFFKYARHGKITS